MYEDQCGEFVCDQGLKGNPMCALITALNKSKRPEE